MGSDQICVGLSRAWVRLGSCQAPGKCGSVRVGLRSFVMRACLSVWFD